MKILLPFFVSILIMITTTDVSGQWLLQGELNGDTASFTFGKSVAFSADGMVMAVGASAGDSDSVFNCGQVKIFRFEAGSWTQMGDDLWGTGVSEYAGESVSLNDDGTIVAFGAYGNDSNGEDAGRVRVYRYENDNWVMLGNPIDGENEGDFSGVAIDLSSDGTILAIGAHSFNTTTYSGQVRVFQYDSTDWVQLGSDIYGEMPSGCAGRSLALSADGHTIAVGAPLYDGIVSDGGYVRVMTFNGTDWQFKGSDIYGQSAGEQFGFSVGLSDDGETMAVSAYLKDTAGTGRGMVQVYSFTSGAWQQIGNTLIGENAGDYFGEKISLSGDGQTLAVGAPANDGYGSNSGHVRVFRYNSVSWQQLGVDINGESPNDQSGSALALTNNGLVLAIGAYHNDGFAYGAGHVRVFSYGSNLGNNEENDNKTLVFPNPARETITIHGTRILQVEVFDINGRLLLSVDGNDEDIKIDVNHLPSGLLLVKIISVDYSETIKIMHE